MLYHGSSRRLAALVAAAGVTVTLLAAAEARADDVRVVVGFHGKADPAVLEKLGGRSDTALTGAVAGTISANKLAELRRTRGVAYVQEDMVRQPSFDPNDFRYNTQFPDFDLINAPEAWNTLSRGSGVTVAVLDTGCQLNHPDIGTAKITKSQNFANGKASDVNDKDGHGTHTAGTVGAKTNNGPGTTSGVASVGFDCKLAIGRVLGPSGGYDSWIAAGIDWSWGVGTPARVISMSLGGVGTSSPLDSALARARAAGVVIVAASGNSGADMSEGSPALEYPAADPNCISVAAVNSRAIGTPLASFSNYGNTVDIAAPGVSVLSTYKGSTYASLSGTSMATPHVAGAAALVWATTNLAEPTSKLKADSVYSRLLSTATITVFDPNSDSLRILDAAAAVTAP